MNKKPEEAPTWKRIPWDGNPELGYECWRKKFGHGHVSVGIGDFLHVGHSFGRASEFSFSSTRWRRDGPISEEQAMAEVDSYYQRKAYLQ